MSVEAIAWVKAQYIPSAPQKLIMMVLADRINNDTGECFPGQELLGRECSMQPRTLRDHLPKLEEAKFIKRSQRFEGNGNRTSDAYSFPGFKEWLAHQSESAREYGERARKPTTGVNPPLVDLRANTGGFTSSPLAKTRHVTIRNNHKENHKTLSRQAATAGEQIEEATTTKSTASTKKPPQRSIASPAFEAVWAIFSDRQGTSKKNAFAQWKAEGCEDCADAVLYGAKQYAAEKARDTRPDRARAQHLERWIKARRWEGYEKAPGTPADAEQQKVRAIALDLANDSGPEKIREFGWSSFVEIKQQAPELLRKGIAYAKGEYLWQPRGRVLELAA